MLRVAWPRHLVPVGKPAACRRPTLTWDLGLWIKNQCRCLPPPQQQPHEPEPLPPQGGASLTPAATEDANTESFFDSLVEPQCGHLVPRQRLERTSNSLSFSHFSQ